MRESGPRRRRCSLSPRRRCTSPVAEQASARASTSSARASSSARTFPPHTMCSPSRHFRSGRWKYRTNPTWSSNFRSWESWCTWCTRSGTDAGARRRRVRGPRSRRCRRARGRHRPPPPPPRGARGRRPTRRARASGVRRRRRRAAAGASCRRRRRSPRPRARSPRARRRRRRRARRRGASPTCARATRMLPRFRRRNWSAASSSSVRASARGTLRKPRWVPGTARRSPRRTSSLLCMFPSLSPVGYRSSRPQARSDSPRSARCSTRTCGETQKIIASGSTSRLYRRRAQSSNGQARRNASVRR